MHTFAVLLFLSWNLGLVGYLTPNLLINIIAVIKLKLSKISKSVQEVENYNYDSV